MVKFLEEKHPELLKFPDEIPHVMNMDKVAGAQLDSDVSAFLKSIKDIEVAVKHVSDADIPDKEPFVRVMSKFLEDTRPMVLSLKAQHESMKEHYSDVVKYFGEGSMSVVPPEELFKNISSFITKWEKVVAENNKIREEKARRARLAEAEAKRKAELEKRKETLKFRTSEQNQTELVDKLMGDVMACARVSPRRRRVGK